VRALDRQIQTPDNARLSGDIAQLVRAQHS
jgi:hypothetical protein